jgi:hypothetical protein
MEVFGQARSTEAYIGGTMEKSSALGRSKGLPGYPLYLALDDG